MAPTPGPGIAAQAGAAASGPSAGPQPTVPAEVPIAGSGVTSRAATPRVTGVQVTRSGPVVTVRFRVNRATKVRVVIRDRAGHVVGRSPLRAARPGHAQRVRVAVPRRARGPVKATITSQPEAKAPKQPGR